MADARDVTVVIPTLRRPTALARALASLREQSVQGFRVVVADNDPAGGAAATVGAAAAAGLDARVVEARPLGVASARNAGVAAAQSTFVAFLDDDETAAPEWLAALLEMQTKTQADVVFGAVVATLPSEVRTHRAFFERFFSRHGPKTGGVIEHAHGCGSSLVRKAALPGPRPFDAARDTIGGEDDLLFARMREAGAVFAWAPQAIAFEHPDPARINLSYVLRRMFAYGQGPASAAAAARPPRFLAVAFWMAAGLAQALFYGLAFAGAFVLRRADRAEWAARAVGGLGKMLWFPPFKQHFYGAAQMRAAERQA